MSNAVVGNQVLRSSGNKWQNSQASWDHSWNAGERQERVSITTPSYLPIATMDQDCTTLTDEQVQTFLTDGVLVVDNVLDSHALAAARLGLNDTLRLHGIHIPEDPLTAQQLVNLSSTNGSGGVLDIFYERWKFNVALHPNLFAMTSQLWKAAYDSHCIGPPHPYGSFDTTKGFMYLDRIGYRVPTDLAITLGSKKRPIQRSLTPHLDCCPETLYDNTNKWRPIQCFVSLSDTILPNEGGFEAVKGFHQEFHTWNRTNDERSVVSPCIGEYTHIRPHEDKAILDRVEHIPVSAGSAVFWDQRYGIGTY